MCLCASSLRVHLGFPQQWQCCTLTLQGLCNTPKQRHPSCQYFTCVYLHAHASTHLISVDFCPFFCAKKLQRKTRESIEERHRGNRSPTKQDLSDGKRRQHLVIASFGISFLLFSLRSFVIIFYNRMSNLPLAGRREYLFSLAPVLKTHTFFHWMLFHKSARYSVACITVNYPLHVWPSPLSLHISPYFCSGVKWSQAFWQRFARIFSM